MSSIAWFDSAFSLQLTTVFLHFLWQGCLIGALVLVGNALLRRDSAKRRYLLNLFALGSLAVCVPITFLLLERPTIATSEVVIIPSFDVESVDRAPLQTDSDLLTAVLEPIEALYTPASIGSSESTAVSAKPESQRNTGLHATDLSTISPYFIACYLLGVCIMLSRLATGVWGCHRLRTRTSQVEDRSILKLLSDQVERFGIKFMPAIAWCEEVSVPVVVGIVKPMILLPATMTSGLTPDQFHSLLTHELAHIRRFDLLANLFQRLVEALLFFHPVVWFVSRRVSIEREHAADDMVLEAGWQQTEYADALVRMAELSAAIRSGGVPHHSLSVAATGTSSSEFKRRVLRLLDLGETPRVSLTRAGLLSLIVVGASLVATPLVVKSWADDKEREESTQQPTIQRIETTDPYNTESGSDRKSEDLYSEDLLYSRFREDEKSELPIAIVPEAATTERTSSIDKTQLPKVAKNFSHQTRVSGSLITGGGIIERIEENTIHFRSSDRIEFDDETSVFFRPEPGKPPRIANASDLKPRMVISYSLRRGQLESLMLEGIVDEGADSATVFDSIKQLNLERGNETSTSLDGRFPMRITGKFGEVQIKQGETKLIELAKPTESIEWRLGEYQPEGVDDVEPFDYLLVQWRENGSVTWTCYRSPPTREPEPSKSEVSEQRKEHTLLLIRSASEFSKSLTEAAQKYAHSSRLAKKGYVSAGQVEADRKQLAILEAELATQLRLLELEVTAIAKEYESKQNELKRILILTTSGAIAISKVPPLERDVAQTALRLEKIKSILSLYQKVHATHFSSSEDSNTPSSEQPSVPQPSGLPENEAAQSRIEKLNQRHKEFKPLIELEKTIDLATGEKRVELLRKAMQGYEDLYKKYRTETLGLWSRFYQARCLWRLGQKDAAEKIFDELIELPVNNEAESKRLMELRKRIYDFLISDEHEHQLQELRERHPEPPTPQTKR